MDNMFEIIGSFFIICMYCSLAAFPITGPIWYFGRRRVKWTWRDYSILIIPSAVWVTLTWIDSSGKSLSNLVEIFYLGGLISIAPILRLIIGKRVNQKMLAIILLVVFCFIAFAMWMFVPGLPE